MTTKVTKNVLDARIEDLNNVVTPTVSEDGYVLTWDDATNAGIWVESISGITIEDNTSTNSVFYLTFTDQTANTETVLNVSSTKLTFNPSTGLLSSTEFNSTSDQTAKDNIQTIDNALLKVNQLRGVNFDWKETGQHSMGVVAQEVENVVPEVVSESNGLKSVNYDAMVGLLIEAIKEQQIEIEHLKNKIESTDVVSG